jgi:hypothetical protein
MVISINDEIIWILWFGFCLVNRSLLDGQTTTVQVELTLIEIKAFFAYFSFFDFYQCFSIFPNPTLNICFQAKEMVEMLKGNKQKHARNKKESDEAISKRVEEVDALEKENREMQAQQKQKKEYEEETVTRRIYLY